jgi:HSP20 family molecular chaperone IbpA
MSSVACRTSFLARHSSSALDERAPEKTVMRGLNRLNAQLAVDQLRRIDVQLSERGYDAFIDNEQAEAVMSSVRMHRKSSSGDELQQVHKTIAERAYDLFLRRGASGGDEWTDWFAAEREMVRRPAIDVLEKDGAVTVSASLAGVEPQEVEVDISPRDVVIKAQTSHWHDERDVRVYRCEFKSGQIFRQVHLPRPVDANRAQADLKNGVLNVTAPIARDVEATEEKK